MNTNIKANNKKPLRNQEDEDTVTDTPQTGDLYTETPMFTQTGYLRREEEQDWDYNPEGDLEIGQELAGWFKEQGFVVRWARYIKDDRLDQKNLLKNQKKGYEFIRKEALPAHFQDKFEGSGRDVDSMKDYVVFEDLVLMAAPIWKNDIVKAKLEEKATRNLRAADDLLHRNVGKSRLAEADALHLINEGKASKVQVGGAREVNYSKRGK